MLLPAIQLNWMVTKYVKNFKGIFSLYGSHFNLSNISFTEWLCKFWAITVCCVSCRAKQLWEVGIPRRAVTFMGIFKNCFINLFYLLTYEWKYNVSFIYLESLCLIQVYYYIYIRLLPETYKREIQKVIKLLKVLTGEVLTIQSLNHCLE